MDSIGNVLQRNNRDSKGIRSKVLSFVQIPNYFLWNPEYSVYEKLLFIILTAHKMNKDKCWPGHERLAKEANCSVTTIKKAIKGLEDKRLLTKSHEKGIKSNVYYVKKLPVATQPTYQPQESYNRGVRKLLSI